MAYGMEDSRKGMLDGTEWKSKKLIKRIRKEKSKSKKY